MFCRAPDYTCRFFGFVWIEWRAEAGENLALGIFQVCGHRGLGFISASRQQGIEKDAMFPRRTFNDARILEPHVSKMPHQPQLLVKRGAEARAPAGFHDVAVDGLIQFNVLRDIRIVRQCRNPDTQISQLLQVDLGNSAVDGQKFQRFTDVIHFLDIIGREGHDLHSAMPFPVHQSILLKQTQNVPYRSAADAEFFGEFLLLQPHFSGVLTCNNAVE